LFIQALSESLRSTILLCVDCAHIAFKRFVPQQYHPRKREGFGRSDGKGCERFWWKLSPLIANLRVQGYHSRLYTLDLQIDLIGKTTRSEIRSWLKRKWETVKSREQELREEYKALIDDHPEWTESYVMEQWNAQVKAQTKPLARQSGKTAKKVVLDIVPLSERMNALRDKIKELNDGMMLDEGLDVEDYSVELEGAQQQLLTMERVIEKKKNALSAEDRVHWKQLEDNKFLAFRMNALALKERLRDQIQMRRFEIDALDRHSSKQKKNSHKLTENAKAHINR